MEKKSKTFKLDAKSIHKKIVSEVKTRLQTAKSSEIRIQTEDYFPAKAFETINSMNDTIALLNNIVEDIRTLPKSYLVNTEFCTFLFPIEGSSHHIEKTFITEIIVMPAPCKEWNTLCNKLKKHAGERPSVLDCRTEQLFGKRSNIDITSTHYLALSSQKCKEILVFLSKRSTKDSVSFKINHELDDADRYNGNGEDREIEYDATRYYSLLVTIETPTGRLKAESSFYV